MIDTKDIKIGKWRMLIPHTDAKTFRCAVFDLYGIVDAYLPYPLAVTEESAEQTPQKLSGENLIIMGTPGCGETISHLLADGTLAKEGHAEGYSIRIMTSPWNPDRQVVLLYGADEAGLLHAVHTFDREYICDILRYKAATFNHRHEPFLETCSEWTKQSYPKVAKRGIWCWGHKIYDYRRFLYNMSALSMNTLTIWNDHVPYNAPEFLAEAHRRGISVYWGYSACWGIDGVDPADPEQQKKWADHVVDTYLNQYYALGGDGVYFQSFTETNQQEIGGVPIAELVAHWADNICKELHRVDPKLDIQFGIHATSVRERYQALDAIDKDVSIIWEDCGGFPYDYSPSNRDSAETALDYTEKLLHINGKDTRFGVVLKGFAYLDWGHFSHYDNGSVVIGEAQDSYLEARKQYLAYTWQKVRPYWIVNADKLKNWCRLVSEADIREVNVTALVEDGMFESTIDTSVALYASLLWDWDQDLLHLIPHIMHAEPLYPPQQP